MPNVWVQRKVAWDFSAYRVEYPTFKAAFLPSFALLSSQKLDLAMLIFQLALGAFLLGGGIITLTNWVAERMNEAPVSSANSIS